MKDPGRRPAAEAEAARQILDAGFASIDYITARHPETLEPVTDFSGGARVLGAAWLTHALHMSMALGGFVGGMMLGESRYRHQLEADIRPFRDLLLGVFLVSVGMMLNLPLLH